MYLYPWNKDINTVSKILRCGRHGAFFTRGQHTTRTGQQAQDQMCGVAAEESNRVATAGERSKRPPHQPRYNLADCEADIHILFIVTKIISRNET